MSLRVVITRTHPEALATAERVEARGAQALMAPLLQIVPCGYDTSVEGAQALIFTSSNGVHAFPRGAAAPDMLVFTVGDATAQAAYAAGFKNVRSANGDVLALAQLIKTTSTPGAGKLLHIAGDHVAGDLSGALRAAGFITERRIAYASQAVSVAPAVLHEDYDVILFHSARAAQTFRTLGAPGMERAIVGCFSQAVAEAAGIGWRRLVVSPAPREDAFLDAVFAASDSPAGASA